MYSMKVVEKGHSLGAGQSFTKEIKRRLIETVVYADRTMFIRADSSLSSLASTAKTEALECL